MHDADPVASLATQIDRLAAAIEAQAEKPEGLDAAGAAALIGVSRAMFHSLVSRGLAPDPIRLGDGNCPRWSRAELLAWFRAGAPARLQWKAMREAALRRSA